MTRVRAEILSTRKLGAFHSLTLVAPEIAEKARPGQFLAVKMPEGREFLLRRHFAIHQASRRGGWAGTLEFVVDPQGPGSEWLGSVKAHEFLEVIGPLGTAFAYPKRHTNCLLVAEGHGAASLYFLAQELLSRYKRVDMVVGAETMERVFKPIEGKRLSQTISIVTTDGSLGDRGSVMDVLAEMVDATGTEVLYAAAPSSTLAQVASFCRQRSIPAQVAVEERMACGIGAVPDVRRARRSQGRKWLRPPAIVRRRPGVQPGAGALGSVALGRSDHVANPTRGPASGAIVAGMKRTLLVDLGGIVMPTPVMIAAGCAGTGGELSGLVDLAEGGRAREPDDHARVARRARPRRASRNRRSGVVWSTGLQNPGIDAFIADELPRLASRAPTWWCRSREAASRSTCASPAALQGRPDVSAIEVYLSGPDLELGRAMLGAHVDRAAEIAGAVARMSMVPVFAKLPMHASELPAIAQAVVRAGRERRHDRWVAPRARRSIRSACARGSAASPAG